MLIERLKMNLSFEMLTFNDHQVNTLRFISTWYLCKCKRNKIEIDYLDNYYFKTLKVYNLHVYSIELNIKKQYWS